MSISSLLLNPGTGSGAVARLGLVRHRVPLDASVHDVRWAGCDDAKGTFGAGPPREGIWPHSAPYGHSTPEERGDRSGDNGPVLRHVAEPSRDGRSMFL